LRRVRIRDAGAMDDTHVLEEVAEVDQGLVIVNSRAHALHLFRAGKERGLEGLTHLTTRQCAAHRREILSEIREHLRGRAPCRVVATSLVEAGVDVDFPRVWRARAGLDQIAQAAGRCNREGLRPVEESIVTLFDAPDHKPPHELRALAEDMTRIALKHSDILSPAAMADYFGEVYWRKGEERLDKFGVLQAFKASGGSLDFSYRRIGEAFRLVESGMEPVIVPYDDRARATLGNLMLANGHVQFVEPRGEAPSRQFALLTTESLYSAEIGLFWENADYLGMESFLI